jgi:hypothetical protein
MAVRERMESGEDIRENALLYDVVKEHEVQDSGPQGTRVNPALLPVNMEESHVNNGAFEVEYLSALGINVVDSTSTLDISCISMLPQYQQVAQYRWNQLYNSADHFRLTKAIAKELHKNNEEYKRRHSKN